MTKCTDYEVELSALLDGESDPATAVRLLDHLTTCSSCREFFRQLRSFQTLMDKVQAAGAPRPAAIPQRRRWYALGAMPRWAWAVVGAFVALAGLWAIDTIGVSTPSISPGRELVIPLGKSRGSMTEGRFVELVVEVLRAEKQYRDQMYVVLDEISRNEALGESPLFVSRHEGAQSEFSGEVETRRHALD